MASQEFQEIPFPVPGHAGYGATRDGRIWSCWQRAGRPNGWKIAEGMWRPLPIAIRAGGYQAVTMRADGVKVTRSVHRLILAAFVSECPEGHEACHLNGIRTDNRLENLRWDTRSGNQRDRRAHGTDLNGSRHPSAKLTESDIPKIFEARTTRKMTLAAIGKEFGVSNETIRLILSGAMWKHSHERMVI